MATRGREGGGESSKDYNDTYIEEQLADPEFLSEESQRNVAEGLGIEYSPENILVPLPDESFVIRPRKTDTKFARIKKMLPWNKGPSESKG
ncbi:hypothetical protein ACFL0Z_03205 [Patescibacteria group bacterium]